MVATFLGGSIVWSVGTIIFVEGGVNVGSVFFCSAKTKALDGDDDDGDAVVKFGVVLFNREVSEADVTDFSDPEPVYAALVFGTAGEMLFGIIKETLLAPAVWI